MSASHARATHDCSITTHITHATHHDGAPVCVLGLRLLQCQLAGLAAGPHDARHSRARVADVVMVCQALRRAVSIVDLAMEQWRASTSPAKGGPRHPAGVTTSPRIASAAAPQSGSPTETALQSWGPANLSPSPCALQRGDRREARLRITGSVAALRTHATAPRTDLHIVEVHDDERVGERGGVLVPEPAAAEVELDLDAREVSRARA